MPAPSLHVVQTTGTQPVQKGDGNATATNVSESGASVTGVASAEARTRVAIDAAEARNLEDVMATMGFGSAAIVPAPSSYSVQTTGTQPVQKGDGERGACVTGVASAQARARVAIDAAEARDLKYILATLGFGCANTAPGQPLSSKAWPSVAASF